jgi:hypothetical protein
MSIPSLLITSSISISTHNILCLVLLLTQTHRLIQYHPTNIKIYKSDLQITLTANQRLSFSLFQTRVIRHVQQGLRVRHHRHPASFWCFRSNYLRKFIFNVFVSNQTDGSFESVYYSII